MLQFPYMGTKKALAPIVAEAARSRPMGSFLDVFSGMCSVANQVQMERSVWTNDLPGFAVNAAKSMLCDPVTAAVKFKTFDPYYREHFDRLSARFRDPLRQERLLLASRCYSDFCSRFATIDALLDRRSARQFDLFSTTYANTYIGVEQAIELDSLIYALHRTFGSGEEAAIVKRKFLFGLGRTLLRASTTTGHFAQFQTPSETNWNRFRRNRQMSIIDSFKIDFSKSLTHNNLH